MQAYHDIRQPPRALHIALAHALNSCRPDDPRLGILNRIYLACSPVDQMRTRAELLECRAARRDQREAIVSFPSDAKGG